MHDPAVVADWYRRSEANCRLEGFDPSGDVFYQEVKARVMAGELTITEASDLLTENTLQKANQDALALAATP
jgi:hypothetical protein